MTATAYPTTNITNYTTCNGIRRSYAPDHRESYPILGGARKISYGDRLFARLVMHGRTIAEFMVNSVSDLTELWGMLRRKCRGIRGLAKLYLRNASRGWSLERPLMLYPDYQPGADEYARAENIKASFRGEARQLSFPWEL